jgi:hypothetical protein
MPTCPFGLGGRVAGQGQAERANVDHRAASSGDAPILRICGWRWREANPSDLH